MTVRPPVASARRRRLADHYLGAAARPTARLRQTMALAASELDFPWAQLNIVDDLGSHTISSFGYDDTGAFRSTPLTDSLCAATMTESDAVAIEDLRQDARSRELPAVVAGHVASYLGVSVRGREGEPVGTLCMVDKLPHSISPEQKDLLHQYALIVEDQLDSVRRTVAQKGSGGPTSDELVDAIETDQIVSWYQPIVELATGRTVGLEALARWQHPDGHVSGPEQFIPLAEDSDLVLDLDRAVLRCALRDLRRFREADPELQLSVNFSVRHLEVLDGVFAIHHAVLDSGTPPAAITVEITESRALANSASARIAVQQLRALGYGVVLDDFGTGFSSADWLLRLPVSGVKVDRSVTQALDTAAGAAIARAIASFTDQLGLTAVIEGIDVAAQAERAARLGFSCGQGYLWSRPIPAADVTSILG